MCCRDFVALMRFIRWILLSFDWQQSNLFSPSFKSSLVGENYKMEIWSELPQNNPEGTEVTQRDKKYGVQALFIYFKTNFYDIPKVVFIPTQSL